MVSDGLSEFFKLLMQHVIFTSDKNEPIFHFWIVVLPVFNVILHIRNLLQQLQTVMARLCFSLFRISKLILQVCFLVLLYYNELVLNSTFILSISRLLFYFLHFLLNWFLEIYIVLLSFSLALLCFFQLILELDVLCTQIVVYIYVRCPEACEAFHIVEYAVSRFDFKVVPFLLQLNILFMERHHLFLKLWQVQILYRLEKIVFGQKVFVCS